MKILIQTNILNEEFLEDLWIAQAFEEDEHKVTIVGIEYDKELDEVNDIIIKRNAWTSDVKIIDKYHKLVTENRKRLQNKKKLKVNFNGNFDAKGKAYLVDLYKKGYEVIPTFNEVKYLDKLEKQDYFLLKPLYMCDGLGQVKCNKLEAKKMFHKDYIIQPILEFTSEVQFYFINNEFKYALEFTPSKVPIYPRAKYYKFSENELTLAQKFANLNNEFIGIQRIDFIKLKDDRLLLLEIEDDSPYLDLDKLTNKDRNNFINDYKKMIYKKFEENRRK